MIEEGCDGVEAKNELVIKSYSFSENCTGSMFVSFLRVLLDFETNDRVRLHGGKLTDEEKRSESIQVLSSILSERRIVGTLISALPDQLKSILTEAEVEQFASRIYSSLVSDGIIGSITIDGVARNKDFAVTSFPITAINNQQPSNAQIKLQLSPVSGRFVRAQGHAIRIRRFNFRTGFRQRATRHRERVIETGTRTASRVRQKCGKKYPG